MRREIPPAEDAGLRWRMRIVRAAGLDPDGRCVPMRRLTPIAEPLDRASDAALLRALYQPAKPWW
jgi:hypothetical protein